MADKVSIIVSMIDHSEHKAHTATWWLFEENIQVFPLH